jgi:hypothetical protein
MKRAMRTITFTQVDDYLGEFHTVGNLNKVSTFNTQIILT